MNLSFQFIDLLVVAIIIGSAVYSTYRGLVSESLAIFGWIAAAYATLYFGPWVAYWMQGMTKPQWLGQAGGYIIIFLIVLIPLQFASSRIAQNIKKSQVGTLDSVLGTGFGILRGIAIVGIAFLVFMMIFPGGRTPDWLATARTFPLIRASAEVVTSITPNQKVQLPQGERSAPPKDPNESSDPIGAKIEQTDTPAQPLPPSVPQKSQAKPDDRPAEAQPAVVPQPRPAPPKPKAAKSAKKTYGAQDRHALDTLIETTNSDKSGKP